MRSDMAKVVTERPRRGHAIGFNERNQWSATRARLRAKDVDDDEWPIDDGYDVTVRTSAQRRGTMRNVKERGDDTKNFSDLLGPLRGYLRKQVDRHWDDVYSELSANLDRRGVSGSHIWDHVEIEVEQEAWLAVDGKIYASRRYGGTMEVSGLFVHPITRRLCYAQERRYRYIDHAAEERKRNTRVVSETEKLERIDGLWYFVTYRKLDPDEIVSHRIDRTTGLPVPVKRCDVRGASMVERVGQRQIGRRDKALWKLAQNEIVQR